MKRRIIYLNFLHRTKGNNQLTVIEDASNDEQSGQVGRVQAETFVQSAWLKEN